MVSKTEKSIVHSIRLILAGLTDGAKIEESAILSELLVSLEFYLPDILREVHTEWLDESLDGIFPALVRKMNANQIEIVGLCILISDQTLTPIHIMIEIDATKNEISWLECCLGECGDGVGGLVRVPYNSMSGKQFFSVGERLNSIQWRYRVCFGQRQA